MFRQLKDLVVRLGHQSPHGNATEMVEFLCKTGFSERRSKHRSFWPPPGMAGSCLVHHLGSAKALVADLRRRDKTTAAEATDRGRTAKAHEAFAAQRQPAGNSLTRVPFSCKPNTVADLAIVPRHIGKGCACHTYGWQHDRSKPIITKSCGYEMKHIALRDEFMPVHSRCARSATR